MGMVANKSDTTLPKVPKLGPYLWIHFKITPRSNTYKTLVMIKKKKIEYFLVSDASNNSLTMDDLNNI